LGLHDDVGAAEYVAGRLVPRGHALAQFQRLSEANEREPRDRLLGVCDIEERREHLASPPRPRGTPEVALVILDLEVGRVPQDYLRDVPGTRGRVEAALVAHLHEQGEPTHVVEVTV